MYRLLPPEYPLNRTYFHFEPVQRPVHVAPPAPATATQQQIAQGYVLRSSFLFFVIMLVHHAGPGGDNPCVEVHVLYICYGIYFFVLLFPERFHDDLSSLRSLSEIRGNSAQSTLCTIYRTFSMRLSTTLLLTQSTDWGQTASTKK